MNTKSTKVKVSSKYQIIIPKEERESINLKAGDRLIMEKAGGDKLILWKPPKNYTEYMAGLHKEVWKGVDPLEYIKTLRGGWERRLKKARNK